MTTQLIVMFLFSNQSRESTMEEPHSHIIMPALFCKVFEQLCRKCSHWSKKMQTNFYRRQNCTIANCIYIKMPDDLSQIFFSIGPIGKERVRLFTSSTYVFHWLKCHKIRAQANKLRINVERRKLMFSFSPMCIVLFKMLIYHFLTLFAQFKEQTKFMAHSSLKTHQAQDYVMLC